MGHSYGGYLLLQTLADLAAFPGRILLFSPVLGASTTGNLYLCPPRADKLLRLAKQGLFPTPDALEMESAKNRGVWPQTEATSALLAETADTPPSKRFLQLIVEYPGAGLQEQMGTTLGPLHLLALDHALADDLVDRRLGGCCRDRLAVAIALAVVGVCSGYVRFFITSGRGRFVADTFDDVPDDTTPSLGANAPMNIAHA